MDEPLTPEQIARIKAAKRRRKERKERADQEWRQQQDNIRRRIAEARKRRQRFLFWLLMAMLAFTTASNFLISRPRFYLSKPAPRPPRSKEKREKKPEKNKEKWQPSPENDFAPKPGSDEYCDGYSRADWEEMAKERGWNDRLKEEWKIDPERPLFPDRYQDFDRRPTLFEITRDFCDPHQQIHAFQALKIAAPPETRKWLDETYTLDPGQIRRAFAHKSTEIAQNFRHAAVRWEEQKRREAEEALKDSKKPKPKEKSKENDDGDWNM